MQPGITFLIVTRNSLGFLRNCLDSILSQTDPFFNILIVDGASTDGTSIFLQSISDPRLKYISETDEGIYDAMNKGIDLIQTEWILHLGSDDTLYSPFVMVELNKLLAVSRDTGLIYGRGVIGKRLLINSFTKRLYLGNCMNHQCVIYKSKLLKEYRYDMTYKIGADYKLNLQLLNKGVISKFTPLIITKYGDEGISSSNIFLARNEELRARLEVMGSFWGPIFNALKKLRWKYSKPYDYIASFLK